LGVVLHPQHASGSNVLVRQVNANEVQNILNRSRPAAINGMNRQQREPGSNHHPDRPVSLNDGLKAMLPVRKIAVFVKCNALVSQNKLVAFDQRHVEVHSRPANAAILLVSMLKPLGRKSRSYHHLFNRNSNRSPAA
jgi:hypothetical protein